MKPLACSALLACAFASQVFAVPEPTSPTHQISEDSNNLYQKYQTEISSLKQALRRYYEVEKSWPASIDVLSSKGYVAKSPQKSLQATGGVTRTGAFHIMITLPSGRAGERLATRLAKTLGGTAQRTTVTFPLTPMVGFINPELYIDRTNPKAMASSIDMNGHWIRAGSLQGEVLDVRSARLESLNVERDAGFQKSLKVGRSLQVTDGSLGNATYLGAVNATSLTVNKDIAVQQDVTATNSKFNGQSTFQGALAVNNNLIANADVFFKSSLIVRRNTIINSASFLGGFVANDKIESLGELKSNAGSFVNADVNELSVKNISLDRSEIKGELKSRDVKAHTVISVNGDFSGNLTTQGLLTKGAINAIRGLMVGPENTLVADQDGNLYYRGESLTGLFLGKDAKAADSFLLDGMGKDEFSRLSANNTHMGVSKFNRIDANKGVYAGSNLVFDDGGVNIYESGVALDKRYLGIKAKAADSFKLDGYSASALAKVDGSNTFSERASFLSGVNVQGDILSGGQLVASKGVLYEGGVPLAKKYLGKNDKAADAELLDGVDSSYFARRDAANTFSGSNSFSGDIKVGGVDLLKSVISTGQRTTSLEGRVDSTNKALDSLLYIKSRCKVHATDPGCRFVFVPKRVVETFGDDRHYVEDASFSGMPYVRWVWAGQVIRDGGPYQTNPFSMGGYTYSMGGKIGYREDNSCWQCEYPDVFITYAITRTKN